MCPPELGCLGKRDRSDISYMRPLKPMTDRPKQPGSMPDKKKPQKERKSPPGAVAP
jgi:hypothetical protein